MPAPGKSSLTETGLLVLQEARLIIGGVIVDFEKLATDLHNVVSVRVDRTAALQEVAELLRRTCSYRWVGLYDVDPAAGIAKNVVWTGPGAPKYSTFPLAKGLTGAAVSTRKTVNVGDVGADPRYLPALGTTRSEIIVPVFDRTGENVLGTIDVESEKPNAFTSEDEFLLEACAVVIRPLWLG